MLKLQYWNNEILKWLRQRKSKSHAQSSIGSILVTVSLEFVALSFLTATKHNLAKVTIEMIENLGDGCWRRNMLMTTFRCW